MENLKLKEYVKSFLRGEEFEKIEDVKDVGIIKYDSVFEEKLKYLEKGDVDKLVNLKDADVRYDDIIKVFSITSGSNEFYIFIKEPIELYSKDYLLGFIKVK